MKIFKDLYQYRELLKTNVRKEIRGKYKGSFLGVLWSFINPLLMVLVYAIVFPLILKSSEPNYVIFLIVGIIPWNFFTTVINQGTTTIVNNGNIIKKDYFPITKMIDEYMDRDMLCNQALKFHDYFFTLSEDEQKEVFVDFIASLKIVDSLDTYSMKKSKKEI